MAPWIGISCSNHDSYKAVFTSHLTPNLLKEFSYAFFSKKTLENVNGDVAQQFGVKSQYDTSEIIKKYVYALDQYKMYLITQSAGSNGGDSIYELSFETDKFNDEDQRAGDEKKNKNAPPIKF